MHRCLFSFIAFGIALVPNAIAGTVQYTDLGSWTAATTNITNFDASGPAIGAFQNYNSALVLTALQGSVIGYNNAAIDFSNVNASAAQPWYNWATGAILRSADKTSTNTVYFRIAFTAPVSAVGFNFGGGGTGPASVTIAPDGLAPVDVTTVGKPTWNFYGLTSDVTTFAFIDIYINDTNRYLVLDNISKGTVNTVIGGGGGGGGTETPESATLLQFAIGIGLIYSASRRLSNNSAANC